MNPITKKYLRNKYVIFITLTIAVFTFLTGITSFQWGNSLVTYSLMIVSLFSALGSHTLNVKNKFYLKLKDEYILFCRVFIGKTDIEYSTYTANFGTEYITTVDTIDGVKVFHKYWYAYNFTIHIIFDENFKSLKYEYFNQ